MSVERQRRLLSLRRQRALLTSRDAFQHQLPIEARSELRWLPLQSTDALICDWLGVAEVTGPNVTRAGTVEPDVVMRLLDVDELTYRSQVLRLIEESHAHHTLILPSRWFELGGLTLPKSFVSRFAVDLIKADRDGVEVFTERHYISTWWDEENNLFDLSMGSQDLASRLLM